MHNNKKEKKKDKLPQKTKALQRLLGEYNGLF